ncbi:MAG: deoxycytidylate deaminase [Desulfosalsimonas sp.]
MTRTGHRPSWDAYFMDLARLVSRRSTCIRRAVGAIIVKDHRILATGYNGAPAGIRHCTQIGCLRETMNIESGQRHELCRGIHAEQNAVIQAAYHGVAIQGGSLYCTNLPCAICTKMLINSGMAEICYNEGYADDLSMTLLDEAGIPLRQVNGVT